MKPQIELKDIIVDQKLEIMELRAENKELKGYRDVIESIKREGFDSVVSIREYCRNYGVLLEEKAALEKQFEESAELCNQQAMRITELEAQIEKMKCCENCKHFQIAQEDGYLGEEECLKGHDGEKYECAKEICVNWELDK